MRTACIWLLTTVLLQAQAPDAAIVPLLRSAAPDLFQVRVLKRVPVDPKLDLVVAVGMPKTYQPGTGESFVWDAKVVLGLFLQSRESPATVYKIAIEAGHADGDCFSRLESATATGVVLSCHPEKGNAGPNRKFVYDIRAKALVGQLEYQPFPLTWVSAGRESAVLMGGDAQHKVAVRYAPAAVSPFSILSGPEAHRWAAKHQATTPAAEIGPTQMADGVLWFGKCFYAGEGAAGTGGFGYFDAQRRPHKIYAPPEIADWSVSALLVEPHAVWLALASYGEWGDNAGGLLRFDRATEKITKIELPDIATSIVRVGGRLLLATEFGAALVEDGVVRRFFVDKTTDGRLRVAEATLGN